MCSVCISGDGSGRTFQCCWWITPSSSQPLSLTASALQHSCCPACSIADTGVTALPVCHAHWAAGGGTGSWCSPFGFCKGWAKPVKQKCEHLQTAFTVWSLSPELGPKLCFCNSSWDLKNSRVILSYHNLRNHVGHLKCGVYAIGK